MRLVGYIIFLCAIISTALGHDNRGFAIDDIKVEPKLKRLQTYGKDRWVDRSNTPSHNRWLVLRVRFVPKKNHNAKSEYIDNVFLDMSMVLRAGNKKDEAVVLDGSAELKYVKLDGRRHYVPMFVPPQVLRRYHTLNSDDDAVRADKIAIRIRFRDASGETIGESYYHASRDDIKNNVFDAAGLAHDNVIGSVSKYTEWRTRVSDSGDIVE